MRGQPDAVYVRRALNGDSSAFQALVSRYSGTIFALVLSHLGRKTDPEDVAQDVFLQGFRSLPNLKDPDKFGPWLYGIGKRVCLNCLRQRKNQKGQEIYFNELADGTDFKDPGTAGGVDTPVHERMDLFDTIDSLQLIYREVVTLRYLEDHSYGEIAEMLGISESAVNVRLIKARRMIRERLERVERVSGRG